METLVFSLPLKKSKLFFDFFLIKDPAETEYGFTVKTNHCHQLLTKTYYCFSFQALPQQQQQSKVLEDYFDNEIDQDDDKVCFN